MLLHFMPGHYLVKLLSCMRGPDVIALVADVTVEKKISC
jgi:hypothetical protein